MKDGFYNEIMEKYNDTVLFDFFEGLHLIQFQDIHMSSTSEIFSWLPVATLVSEKVLIVHGGLSAVSELTLDDIRRIPRGNSFQPDDSDLLCDLLWSDPLQVGGRSLMETL